MYLNTRSRVLLGAMVALAILMIMVLGLHWFGSTIVTYGLYSQLVGAIVSGIVIIASVSRPIRFGEEAEPWLDRERLSWLLIGLGALAWGGGEAVYRVLLAQNLPTFPALSDLGYATLPPLMFIGLLLQPSSGSGRTRLLVVLDSLISMGSILAIAWFLLLGMMAQSPDQADLAKILGLYYPISDMALLSCVVFLLVRGQGQAYEVSARRVGLLLIAIGLIVFAVSDFNYNFQNNMGTYDDGTWADLGWPLGLMILAIGAHLRRFIPATSGDMVEQRVRRRAAHFSFGPTQIIPYFLLGMLFIVLVFNVISTDPVQIWNRPVLLAATLCVIALVVTRQLITQLENERLSRRQAVSLESLAVAHSHAEDQARMIAERNISLEEGIAHLKEIQAQIANGNLRARARINNGDLVSLAGSFNLMADRLTRLGQADAYAQRLKRALSDLSRAFEVYRSSGQFATPASCAEFPDLQRLLLSMGLRQVSVDFERQAPNTPLPETRNVPGRSLANPQRSSSTLPLSGPGSSFSQRKLPPLTSGPLSLPGSLEGPNQDFPPTPFRRRNE